MSNDDDAALKECFNLKWVRDASKEVNEMVHTQVGGAYYPGSDQIAYIFARHYAARQTDSGECCPACGSNNPQNSGFRYRPCGHPYHSEARPSWKHYAPEVPSMDISGECAASGEKQRAREVAKEIFDACWHKSGEEPFLRIASEKIAAYASHVAATAQAELNEWRKTDWAVRLQKLSDENSYLLEARTVAQETCKKLAKELTEARKGWNNASDDVKHIEGLLPEIRATARKDALLTLADDIEREVNERDGLSETDCYISTVKIRKLAQSKEGDK